MADASVCPTCGQVVTDYNDYGVWEVRCGCSA